MGGTQQRIGLVLSGGGARAAYQVGVLRAIAEFLPRHARSPFQVISGTSAGSLNAVALAVNALHFRKGVQYLLGIWKHSRVSDIYRTDPLGVLSNSLRWLAGLLFGSLGIGRLDRVSLLDNSPLATFLEQTLPCDQIQQAIDAGALYALAVTASGYGSGHSVTFFQGAAELRPWRRSRRMGVATRIGVDHLLASSAIPFLFPAVHIHREYFGDGSMRQIAPISAVLHLGAERVMVIGMGYQGDDGETARVHGAAYPSLAQIAGHALDSIFLDTLQVDIERVQRLNDAVRHMTPEAQRSCGLRHIEVLLITPSRPLEPLAARHVQRLPWTIRFMLRMVGVLRGSGTGLLSYLLFERHYCRDLIELGYQDALQRKDEILRFLAPDTVSREPATP